jgi:hypothetical protein
MDSSQLPRKGAGTFNEPGATRAGQPTRAGGAVPARRSRPPADRRSERFAAAERNLADTYRRLRALGVDPDSVDSAFAILRDTIAEIKACADQARRELDIAHYEWERARRRQLNPVHSETSVSRVIPDLPGVNLCPDPGAAETPAEFMDTLRRYWIWSGKPSYRVMERECGRRFAASTIYTALKADRLPSFDMVQAVMVACGASAEHQRSFRSAWRRLEMGQAANEHPARPRRSRALRAVSETA